jgi:hypothetical protein
LKISEKRSYTVDLVLEVILGPPDHYPNFYYEMLLLAQGFNRKSLKISVISGFFIRLL